MKATREEMKAEALRRMRKLGIVSDAVKQFKDDDTVMVSEGGILYWLDDDQKQAVKEFEEAYGGLVFMAIHNNTEFGELLAMLYVSDNKEYWEYDNADLLEGIAFAYVKNITDDSCSECGTIGVRNRFGGLIRTY